ncbi:glycosylase [Streptomyces phage Blueeyedbeauty]|uniref:NADAR domain-containing protein n=1 Tax=Streptomyces phage Blueeyedbeauty TaxID=2250336 RepID=A0A345L202_9CAUD|nr:glycosylase [Streptomyces phage Blueeyedbeauty]AXH49304.1 hypothetical protein SEA_BLUEEYEDBEAUTY_196 [Streptomyces phage Blueeyedbeauty]
MHVVPKFEGDYFFLSNFYEAPIIFSSPILAPGEDGLKFMTGEHAFQAAKIHAMDPVDKQARMNYVVSVANAPTPSKAKYLGRSVKIDLDKWDSIKDECMREVVFQKFLQHPELRTQLRATGSAMLVEGNTWGDTYWGRADGKGYNKLGAILMEVRGWWHWQARRNQPEMGS